MQLAENDPLSATEISAKLRNGGEVRVYGEVDSTMNVARQAIVDGAADKTVIFAETQTAGRGRRGHSFFSPPYTGIYFSVILRPKKNTTAANLITVLAAVAVCRGLSPLVAPHLLQIKWVNDILLNGKKVGGILTEAELQQHSAPIIVVGIGVNITTAEFPQNLQNLAGACADLSTLPVHSRNDLAAALLNHFFSLYDADDQAAILEEYRDRSAVLGREIFYQTQNKTITARAEQITDAGHLVVRLANGELTTLNAGEISLRLQTGNP